MNFKCPGQDKRFIEVNIMKCPKCNFEVEMFSDEVKAKCPKCSEVLTREVLPSCIDWCKYAKECVGGQTYSIYMQDKQETLKQKLIKEMEDYFASDTKRINHAKMVMHFAEELLRQEKADWHIVIPASILHDIGIKAAEEKYSSAAPKYQEQEGPAIAKNMLLKLGFKKEDIEEICQIIAHHHSPGKIDTHNFKLLYDADGLVNFAESEYFKRCVSASRLQESRGREKEETYLKDRVKLKEAIDRIFLTKAGKEMAHKLYP